MGKRLAQRLTRGSPLQRAQGLDQAMVMLSALDSSSVGAAGVAGGGEHRYCSVSSFKNREATKARESESAPPGEAEVPRREGAGSGLAVGSHPHLRSQSGCIPSPIGLPQLRLKHRASYCWPTSFHNRGRTSGEDQTLAQGHFHIFQKTHVRLISCANIYVHHTYICE